MTFVPIAGCSYCASTAGVMGCPYHGPPAKGILPTPTFATAADPMSAPDGAAELLEAFDAIQPWSFGGHERLIAFRARLAGAPSEND